MPMIAATLITSGNPSSSLTNASAVEPSSCGRSRIWDQQLPNPSDSAVSCSSIAAMAQSSI
jgi:hypothetical protein